MVNLSNSGKKDFVEYKKFIWLFLSIADITWKVYLGQNILYHVQKIWSLNKQTKMKFYLIAKVERKEYELFI